jgi:hypothetical protein
MLKELLFVAACVASLLIQSASFGQQSILLNNSPILGFTAKALSTPAKDSMLISKEVLAPFTVVPATEFEGDWKNWSVVENYTFGKDRGTLTMITDLNALHPYFRDKIRQLMAKCRAQGIELAVVETFRTHAKQNEYKGMGRAYTNSTGGKSKHQYGLAVDVVPMVNNAAVWNNAILWRKIGVAGEKLGLRWGGRWKKPYDPAHFEWTGGLTSTHLSTGVLPMVPDEKYPCIEEDIVMLRQYWREWETAQSASAKK